MAELLSPGSFADGGARRFQNGRMDILIFSERSDGLQIKEFACSTPGEKRKLVLGVREPYFLHFILSGNCDFHGKMLGPGDAFFLTSGKPHSHVSTDGYALIWFALTGASAPKLLLSFGVATDDHAAFRVRYPDYVREELLRAHAFCVDHPNDCASVAEGALLFFLSMIETGNCTRKHLDTMEQAAAFFRDNYYRPLRMESVAQQFFLSEKYFCRRFRERYGVPPQRYLLQLRMDRAASLLVSTDLKIKEVAASVGYDSSLTFSTIFKKWRGKTPGEYRRTATPDNRPNTFH